MLLSYLVFSVANAAIAFGFTAIAFGFTAMYTITCKKTMGGHLEKRIREQVMATFVIII